MRLFCLRYCAPTAFGRESLDSSIEVNQRKILLATRYMYVSNMLDGGDRVLEERSITIATSSKKLYSTHMRLCNGTPGKLHVLEFVIVPKCIVR